MAHINILVDNDKFIIELDDHDWQSLTVNGESIAKDPGIGWKWSQQKSGAVSFEAVTNVGQVLTPNYNHLLSGQTQAHLAELSFKQETNGFRLRGYLANADLYNAKPGEFNFNQGLMTGSYRHV